MTVTITPTVQLSTTPPSVALAITTTTETSTTILRNNPDGTQSPVRTSDGNPLPTPSHSGSLTDNEPPYGQALSYTSIESPGTVSAAVTVSPPRPWLVHPGVPALSVQILRFKLGSLVGNTYAMPRGVFRPMGRRNAVVVTGGVRQGASGSFTITTQTATDLSNLNALLSTGQPLLLNIPAGLGFTFPTSYVSIGDIKQTPSLTALVVDQQIDTVCPFDVVDAPVGGSQAARSYADLLAYSSYQQADTAYSSYTGMLTGP